MINLIIGLFAGSGITAFIFSLMKSAKGGDWLTERELIANKLDEMADTYGDYGDGDCVPGLRAAAEVVRKWVEE